MILASNNSLLTTANLQLSQYTATNSVSSNNSSNTHTHVTQTGYPNEANHAHSSLSECSSSSSPVRTSSCSSPLSSSSSSSSSSEVHHLKSENSLINSLNLNKTADEVASMSSLYSNPGQDFNFAHNFPANNTRHIATGGLKNHHKSAYISQQRYHPYQQANKQNAQPSESLSAYENTLYLNSNYSNSLSSVSSSSSSASSSMTTAASNQQYASVPPPYSIYDYEMSASQGQKPFYTSSGLGNANN